MCSSAWPGANDEQRVRGKKKATEGKSSVLCVVVEISGQVYWRKSIQRLAVPSGSTRFGQDHIELARKSASE